jgi:hypothetical protein
MRAERLIDGTGLAPRCVLFSRPVADVQHLARVGADRRDRVIAKPAGIAVEGFLFLIAADLVNEAFRVDHQRPIPRPAPPNHALASATSKHGRGGGHRRT